MLPHATCTDDIPSYVAILEVTTLETKIEELMQLEGGSFVVDLQRLWIHLGPQ
jgi:hypothetical protein